MLVHGQMVDSVIQEIPHHHRIIIIITISMIIRDREMMVEARIAIDRDRDRRLHHLTKDQEDKEWIRINFWDVHNFILPMNISLKFSSRSDIFYKFNLKL